VKYARYEDAVAAALADTPEAKVSVVMVVGAGRGACLSSFFVLAVLVGIGMLGWLVGWLVDWCTCVRMFHYIHVHLRASHVEMERRMGPHVHQPPLPPAPLKCWHTIPYTEFSNTYVHNTLQAPWSARPCRRPQGRSGKCGCTRWRRTPTPSSRCGTWVRCRWMIGKWLACSLRGFVTG
jgi:hypothetical protein